MIKTASILLLILAGCINQNGAKIILKNETAITFDSTIIIINNFKIRTTQLLQKSKLETYIPVDSIEINKHDLLIRVYLYSKYTSDTLYGSFYTDLGGNLSNKYEVLVNEYRKISIAPKE